MRVAKKSARTARDNRLAAAAKARRKLEREAVDELRGVLREWLRDAAWRDERRTQALERMASALAVSAQYTAERETRDRVVRLLGALREREAARVCDPSLWKRRCLGDLVGPWCGVEATHVCTSVNGLQWFACEEHMRGAVEKVALHEWFARRIGLPE